MGGEVLLRQGNRLFLLFLTETLPVLYSMAPSPDVTREPRFSHSFSSLLKGSYKDTLNNDVPLQRAIVGSSIFHFLVQHALNTDDTKLVECLPRETFTMCTLEVPRPLAQLEFECLLDYRIGLLYCYTADSKTLYVMSYGAGEQAVYRKRSAHSRRLALPGNRSFDKFRKSLYYWSYYVSDLRQETLQLLLFPIGGRLISWLQGLSILTKTLAFVAYWMLFVFVHWMFLFRPGRRRRARSSFPGVPHYQGAGF